MSRKGAGPLPGQVPQPPLDQVAGDGRSDRLGDHEAHPRGRSRPAPGRARATARGSGPPSGVHRCAGRGARPPGSEQVRSGDCWGRARPAAHASGSEAVATLATTGGEDGAAGAGAHAQAEAMGLVPTTVVRLERALAQLIHSTQGGLRDESVTGSGRASRTPVAGQLAPLAHASADCHGHAAPVDAGQTCQRYVVRRDRVNSVEASGRQSRTVRRPGQLSTDTPRPGDNSGRYLWTTVDPQAPELLASVLPGSPKTTGRPPLAISRSIPRSGDLGEAASHLADITGSKREQTVEHGGRRSRTGTSVDIAQPVDKGVDARATSTHTARHSHLKGSATGRGRITEHRRQPGK